MDMPSKRLRRKIVGDLIERGLTPGGKDFFKRLDSEEKVTLRIGDGAMIFPSPADVQEELRMNIVAAYFPNEILGSQMLRYIALTNEERQRVLRRALAALRSLGKSLDEEPDKPDDPKKNKA